MPSSKPSGVEFTIDMKAKGVCDVCGNEKSLIKLDGTNGKSYQWCGWCSGAINARLNELTMLAIMQNAPHTIIDVITDLMADELSQGPRAPKPTDQLTKPPSRPRYDPRGNIDDVGFKPR